MNLCRLIQNRNYTLCLKYLSSEANASKSSQTKKQSHHDLIGPADKISNLRQIKFYIPPDETPLEREYRQMRERILEFNQRYWTEQNVSFIESRREFNEKLRNKKRVDEKFAQLDHSYTTRAKDANTSENLNDSLEMNEFYKQFLNENYHKHYKYNRLWFKMNLSLLWPATRVFFYRLLNRNKFFK